MRTSLLEYYQALGDVPAHAVAEARGWGLELRNPVHDHWDTVSDFVDAYCRDLTPAGVLVVASDPSVAGAVQTGIPFTDAAHARHVLSLETLHAEPDLASQAFWGVVTEARKRAPAGATLEGLFSGVHFAHAFPFALVSGRQPVSAGKYLPSMPLYAEESRKRLSVLVRMLRPQVVACVGRASYEAVASLAENRLDLAAELATRGWDGVVLAREYADGLRVYPKAEFGAFRSALVPVGELVGPMTEHAQDTLLRLLGDAWN